MRHRVNELFLPSCDPQRSQQLLKIRFPPKRQSTAPWPSIPQHTEATCPVSPWADTVWIKPTPGLVLDWCQTGRTIGVYRGMLGTVLANGLHATRAGLMGDRP